MSYVIKTVWKYNCDGCKIFCYMNAMSLYELQWMQFHSFGSFSYFIFSFCYNKNEDEGGKKVNDND